MARTSIPQTIAKLRIGTADKLALTNLFNAQADDIELLRTALNGALAKIDAGGATVAAMGTNNAATLGITPVKLNLAK
jgi:hypothetical protein